MGRPGLPILFAILLGLVGSFFWDPGTLISPDSEVSDRERRLPQTYLEEARTWTFDEQGALSEIMEAARVRHFQRRDESLLESPRFYSHNGDDKTWSAVADRGHYRPSTQVLTLRENVVLTNDASGGRLETGKMKISLLDKIATSNVPVTITQGLNSTRADGMRADLEKERIRMRPNVESVYVRPQ